MLSDIGSVGFKVDNFNDANMEIFQNNWADIKNALTLTVQLVASFGFNGQNLSAHNSILPIAYYLYKKGPGDSYLTVGRFAEDRRVINDWLVRSLLKSGIWGSGLDTLLTALRRVIAENDSSIFPSAKIREDMARRGKSLTFENEEIEDLCDMQYGDGITFALLSLIFRFVDLSNQFHVDHIFPKSRFTEKKLNSAGIQGGQINDFIQKKERLANLQLLDGAVNNEKRASLPAAWLSKASLDVETRREYQARHMLGDVPQTLTGFGDFYAARRERLKLRIGELLGR